MKGRLAVNNEVSVTTVTVRGEEIGSRTEKTYDRSHRLGGREVKKNLGTQTERCSGARHCHTRVENVGKHEKGKISNVAVNVRMSDHIQPLVHSGGDRGW